MHKHLFSQETLSLGQIHWYLLKADAEMAKRRWIPTKRKTRSKKLMFAPWPKSTQFGREVGNDEIHWWVFKMEPDLHELKTQTEAALIAAQTLKEASRNLVRSHFDDYELLILALKSFARKQSNAIDTLKAYVLWLFKKNVLAPAILFTFRVWGSTRISDRSLTIKSRTFQQEKKDTIRRLTEIVCGLFRNGLYTVVAVQWEIGSVLADGHDPEDPRPIRVSPRHVANQASFEVLSHFAEYFQCMRDSINNVLIDIENCVQQNRLMKSDRFWRNFVLAATTSKRSETELWDFKETLSMWHIKGGEEKADAEFKFAETVAGFANNKGGVLVVGVTDTQRRVVGIDRQRKIVEARLKYTRDTISKYLHYSRDITYFHEVLAERTKPPCLVIAIAQTASPVGVRDRMNRFTYPIRRATGLTRVTEETVHHTKAGVHSDNYDYIQDLDLVIRERRAH
jgi:hypothetical protein